MNKQVHKNMESHDPNGIEISSKKEILTNCVIFNLDSQIFAIEIFYIQEITGLVEITYLEGGKPYFIGTINLRSFITPVIDLRIRFNIPQREYDSTTVILVVEAKMKLLGLIVDSISDITAIPLHEIKDMPEFTPPVEENFIKAAAGDSSNIITILNVEEILFAENIFSNVQ
ncbi:MAG: purine-binding chemotaxis protein CheW [bacterium]|nr:purine-binding chemotaxis protein CheW [bacterium]